MDAQKEKSKFTQQQWAKEVHLDSSLEHKFYVSMAATQETAGVGEFRATAGNPGKTVRYQHP